MRCAVIRCRQLRAFESVVGLGAGGDLGCPEGVCIIPTDVVSISDLFQAAEASWRVPLVPFTAMSGIAFGS